VPRYCTTSLLLVFFLLIGCFKEKVPELSPPIEPPIPISPTSESLIPSSDYILKTLNSKPYKGPNIKITVDGARIHGKAHINQFSFLILREKAGPITTSKLEGEPEQMEQESNFLQLLEGATLNMTNEGDLAARKGGIAYLIFQKIEPK